MQWREDGEIRWLQARMPGATVAFSTRLGGASVKPFDSLNLGLLTDDEASAVTENRHRLAAALDLDTVRIAIGHQVHGAELATHSQTAFRCSFSLHNREKEQRKGGDLPEVDGHVIAEPGLAALVFVADCLPVAMCGPDGVAILHCGWRGLAAGIVAKGATAIGATHAAIGPGIGSCCYEVGEEVLDTFSGLDGVAAGRMLDLPEVARQLLREAGIRKVESAGLCTSCEEELFFSHRRDEGRTGRQAGLVWLDGKEA
jgi:purine-nucleoside/S-methyl-5'-thioadenosine phosphorylase / adenosine deaminase